MIRKATIRDVKPIHKLISEQAKTGGLLGRALSELYSHVRDFCVAVDPQTDLIVGCGALQIVWENLAEIRSLAVTSSAQRQGVGTNLIKFLMKESKKLEITEVFVLTYRQHLFESLGFRVMDKGMLPHKIWADCIKCTKFPDCDEIAMVGKP